MESTTQPIKTVIARIITDKPVRKTPYQVKGVFMRQYPDLEVIPMLDGSYRNRYLYPRVQIKILNEQIYMIGINEGAEPVLELADRLDILDFGNITFQIFDTDINAQDDQFRPIERLIRYRFLTPWVALNQTTGNRYRFLNNVERVSFLNRLLGQNIVFLAREMGLELQEKIFTKVNLTSMFPKPVDVSSWGAFSGEFRANFILPNYMGIGNGITRGFGAIYGMFNSASFQYDESKLDATPDNVDEAVKMTESELEGISEKDVPKPKRRKLTTNKEEPTRPLKPKPIPKKKKMAKKVLSEEFEIEDDGEIEPIKKTRVKRKTRKKTPPIKNNEPEELDPEDVKFNSPEYHKKQHNM